jgi:hypothetical protein
MPPGSDIVVIESAALTVIESPPVAVREPLSVTRTVMLDVPAAVGVPVIAPDDAFNVNPGGSVPVAISHVYGIVPPAAASVDE